MNAERQKRVGGGVGVRENPPLGSQFLGPSASG